MVRHFHSDFDPRLLRSFAKSRPSENCSEVSAVGRNRGPASRPTPSSSLGNQRMEVAYDLATVCRMAAAVLVNSVAALTGCRKVQRRRSMRFP